eukprot:70985_1
MLANIYSCVDALKLVDDEIPSGDCNNLEFSRIYKLNRNKNHISGRMAHRLYLQGILQTDEICNFEDFFIDGLFRGWDDKKDIRITQSYLDFMIESKHFHQLMAHALNRILCRLIKGFGFKCNCIAERVLAYDLMVKAQDAFIDATEMYNFGIEGTFDNNSWQFEKERKGFDVNFLLVMQRELSINMDKSLNNACENSYKYVFSALDEKQKQYNELKIKYHDRVDRLDFLLEGIIGIKEKMAFLKQHEKYLIDYDNPNIGIWFLIKSWKLNAIHPSKWFVPFNCNRVRIFDFYWNHSDWKRVKLVKRCVVCKKKGNKWTGIRLKTCKECKEPLYCSRKCQKYHWKHEHGPKSGSVTHCRFFRKYNRTKI